MAAKPSNFFQTKTGQQVAVVAFLLVAAGGLVYWKNSSNPPQAMDSSANVELPHWPHSKLPFQLSMVNQGSGKWSKNLNTSTGGWDKSGVVNYRLVKGSSKRPCDMYAEGMKFCSYSAQDQYLGGAVFVQAPNSPHIIGATVKMNDYYYFGRGSTFNNDAWRNRDLCWLLGITLGAAQTVDADPNIASCMNLNVDNTNVALRQLPDENDYNWLRQLYSHKDDDSSSAIAYKLDSANQLFDKAQYGSAEDSLSSSQVESYTQDLGDGYLMKTVFLKAAK